MLIFAQIDDKSLQFLFIGDFSFLSQVKKLNFSSQNLNLCYRFLIFPMRIKNKPRHRYFSILWKKSSIFERIMYQK